MALREPAPANVISNNSRRLFDQATLFFVHVLLFRDENICYFTATITIAYQ